MIGTPNVLTRSKNSPMGSNNFEQHSLGSWQRVLRSKTTTAVDSISKLIGFASGLLGPSIDLRLLLFDEFAVHQSAARRTVHLFKNKVSHKIFHQRPRLSGRR